MKGCMDSQNAVFWGKGSTLGALTKRSRHTSSGSVIWSAPTIAPRKARIHNFLWNVNPKASHDFRCKQL